MRCPRCGFESAEGLRFCGNCGVPLTHSAPERRQITVMFCDMIGSTPLAERLGPEEFRQVLHSYQETGVETITRFGGYIARYVGDGLLIYFGYPQAHGDDAQRAVHAALEVVRNIESLNTRLRQEKGIELAVRIGIHTGLVVVGEMGGGVKQEPIAVGETPYLATQLQDVAEPNTVVISTATHQLVQEAFDCHPSRPHRLKDISHPVESYRVLGAAESVQAHGLEMQGLHSPLVGREKECAAFADCIERLLTGRGCIVSVIGEAGLGKSRLVTEIRENAPLDHLHWLEGHALSFGQSISYWPFQEIIRSYASISEEDSEHTAWDKLERRVEALFPDSATEVLPYLACLLALEMRGEYEEQAKYLDGEAMGRQIYLTSRRFFERLAQERPVVLVFEDLHWADQSSVELLEHLMPLVERVPLLLCGVGRSYRHSPAVHLREVAAQDHADCYTEIALDPLSAAESTQLVHNLLEVGDLSPGWREAILSKAEGNPFFVEEVLRSLIDVGAIVRDAATGHWHIAAQVGEIAIPDTIQGVIIARVDRLEEDVKQVLRMASVIGRSFLYRVLRAVAEAERDLDRHLEELQQVELIHEKRRIPELEYIFRHALAQEAVYESVLLQRRREMHAQVGACIETLLSDRLDEFYGLLAYHYARAEDWEKAQEYLFKAGDQAGQVAADTEALAHYKRAMTAYARAFGDRWDPVQRASLERKMGEALFRRGEHVQALEYMQRALEHLSSPFPTSRWGIRLAFLGEVARQIGHRLLSRLFLKPTKGQITQAIEEEARIYECMCWIDVLASPERFLLDSLKLLNFSERNDFLLGVVQGFTGIETLADFFSVFWLAERYGHWAVALAEQIQHPGALGVAYQCLGFHELQLGRLDAAIECGERGSQAYRNSGYWNLRSWAVAVLVKGSALVDRGDFVQALTYARELVRFGQDANDHQVLCWGLLCQGEVQLRIGPLEAAITTLERNIELTKVIPDHMTRVLVVGELAQCYLWQGELEQALAMMEECRCLSKEHNVRATFVTPLRNGLAEAYLLTAERSGGSVRAKWLRKAKRACRDALKQGQTSRPGLPEATMLRGRYEWLRAKPKAAQKWWRRGLVLAEEMGKRYDPGVIYLEMGRRLKERVHLERAEAIFAKVGAARGLAQARELLEQIN